MMKYFLSLGSNINPELNLDFAISSLSKILRDTKCSSIYKTQAEGFDGDDFLNLVYCGTSLYRLRVSKKN
jgi:2-amino-4-hydroxy-6-hydroxymethyldihydropteridine diphosphokinase